MATPKIVADFETQLASAVSVGSTSFTLSSATDDDGNAIPSGKYYFTFENASSNKEYVVGTVSGTSVTSVSTVSRQGAETSGFAKAHRVGSSIIISDFLTYKNYMDEIALVSAPDADTSTKGVVEAATLAEVRARTASGGSGAALVVTPDVCDDLPTQDEKAALAGTSGSPSGSNKFVTADDVSNSGGSGKIVRANGLNISGTLNGFSRLIGQSDATSDLDGTTTSEQTAATIAIPANTLGTANAVRAKFLFSDISLGAVSTTLTIRVKYGSTTIGTFTTGSHTSNSNFIGSLECVLVGNGGTSAQAAFSELDLQKQQLDPTIVLGSSTKEYLYGVTTGTATENSTGALNFVLTFQFSGAHSNNAFTLAGYTVERLA